jgi:hypothetical protein
MQIEGQSGCVMTIQSFSLQIKASKLCRAVLDFIVPVEGAN